MKILYITLTVVMLANIYLQLVNLQIAKDRFCGWAESQELVTKKVSESYQKYCL